MALAVLIHGDAAFPGQGVVAETFNLQSLEGYATGGTLHLITNNQVGFTTDPTEGRSTRYSSDLAKGFDVPIVHVNADDPEAALTAVRLALAYRAEFGHDFVIDLVGYRRFGHQEQDEAAYTQPLQAEQIQSQPTVRERYAARLAEAGVVSAEQAEAIVRDVTSTLRASHDRLRASIAEPPAAAGRAGADRRDRGRRRDLRPATSAFVASTSSCSPCRTGFTVNPKLAQQLDRRRETIDAGGIDWGQAEALAFASLLEDGIPIRLSGQDTERGTFSHRHLVLHEPESGETVAPIQHLPGANASFEVYNSPLSEYAALGFEYGYSVSAPDALVLWEAQFGDFVNGAQIVIDQFIVAGRSKWKQTSRLTLLLPARVRGQRAGALERAPRALSPARRAGEHPRRELHDRRPVLPPPPPAGARCRRAPARADDAEGPAPAQGGDVGDRRPRERRVPGGAGRTVRRPRRRRAARALLGEALLRHRRSRGPRAGRQRRRRSDRAALPVPG